MLKSCTFRVALVFLEPHRGLSLIPVHLGEAHKEGAIQAEETRRGKASPETRSLSRLVSVTNSDCVYVAGFVCLPSSPAESDGLVNTIDSPE